MIVIQMAGGLGNQMFQYALYKQLTAMGKTVKMDDEAGFREDEQRAPALAAFGITYERATRREIMQMTDSSPALTARVRRKLFGRHKKSYFEESKRFLPEIFTWDDIYLEGYWQSEKYFADVGEILKEEFSIGRIRQSGENGYGLSGQAEDYLRRMENTQSVSIHVRRGDYLLPQNQELFGNICTEHYYEQAMQRIIEQYPDAVFYLFTNDREWARDRIEAWHGIRPAGNKITNDIILVDPPGEKDYEALTLMSRCRHNILANSSFSWWASYLNDNPHKIVISPDKWLNGWDCRDIYRADMIIVS
ncbi:MAG: alpha-1,2-fucosyltransferase [Roseburia sp.]|nr:alpha-1,2-fucosyltransferase [Roseburia sp.]MCM1241609.1 alpha-1,2-fucosyltransferase [Roseburia sp.]